MDNEVSSPTKINKSRSGNDSDADKEDSNSMNSGLHNQLQR